MQDSDRRPASNPCPISMSQTSVLQIYALFSNSQIGVLFQILKSASNSQIYGRFSLFQFDVQFENTCDNEFSACRFESES